MLRHGSAVYRFQTQSQILGLDQPKARQSLGLRFGLELLLEPNSDSTGAPNRRVNRQLRQCERVQ